ALQSGVEDVGVGEGGDFDAAQAAGVGDFHGRGEVRRAAAACVRGTGAALACEHQRGGEGVGGRHSVPADFGRLLDALGGVVGAATVADSPGAQAAQVSQHVVGGGRATLHGI